MLPAGHVTVRQAESGEKRATTIPQAHPQQPVDAFSVRRSCLDRNPFIVGDDTAPDPERLDAIIRGVELQLKSRLLPIRDSSPADPTSCSPDGV